MRRVNIRDVAKSANVSVATVSKALNGYTDVNEETRKRILEVANRLNYVADSNARNMGGKVETTTVALLLSELRTNDSSGFVYGILSGVYTVCKERGYDFMLLATTPQEQQQTTLLELCRKNGINGLVATGFRLESPYVAQMKQIDIPVSLVDMDEKGKNLYNASIDNTKAAYQATTFLLQKGHRHIALLTGYETADVSGKRLNGYIQALEQFGLTPNMAYIKNCDFYEEKATQITRELLYEYPELTAIFAISDLMAIGACRAIEQMGKVAGEDIDVIGFDDIPIAKYLFGGISTIHQNPFQLGYTACDAVCRMLRGESTENIPEIPFDLVLRKTATP